MTKNVQITVLMSMRLQMANTVAGPTCTKMLCASGPLVGATKMQVCIEAISNMGWTQFECWKNMKFCFQIADIAIRYQSTNLFGSFWMFDVLFWSCSFTCVFVSFFLQLLILFFSRGSRWESKRTLLDRSIHQKISRWWFQIFFQI